MKTRTKIRKIGNSVGIILNKNTINQCNISDEVFLSVVDSKIIIEPYRKKSRFQWKEKFFDAKSLSDKEIIFDDFENDFDKEEWTW